MNITWLICLNMTITITTAFYTVSKTTLLYFELIPVWIDWANKMIMIDDISWTGSEEASNYDVFVNWGSVPDTRPVSLGTGCGDYHCVSPDHRSLSDYLWTHPHLNHHHLSLTIMITDCKELTQSSMTIDGRWFDLHPTDNTRAMHSPAYDYVKHI